jgi:RNA polymerase sigma-70 factor, ECF subfamily
VAEGSHSAQPTAADAAGRGSRANEQAAGLPVDLVALVRAHHAAVYRYACRLCGNAVEAEDLTQQTFLIAHTKLHQLREADRACSWLLAVVRSCFLKSLRKPRPVAANVIDLNVNEVAETSEIDEVDREQLAAALAELPEEFRLVVLMFYFEELSYQEISAELDIPIGTVMSRLSRAKGHLRSRLAATSADARPAPLANGHEPAQEPQAERARRSPANSRH